MAVRRRSGRRNVEERRCKMVARKREGTTDHRKERGEVEKRREKHATKSLKGRKQRRERKKTTGYYGYKITVKGTRGGARRPRTYVTQKGKRLRGRKKGRRMSHEQVAKTTVGTLGVRVQYCYGRG